MTKRFIILLLLLVVPLTTSAEDRQTEAPKDRQGILVEKSIANMPPIWCGSGNQLLYDNDEGTILYDVVRGNKRIISDGRHWPLGCTNDGLWYLYLEYAGSDEKEGTLAYVWRYKLSTGLRQRIAVAYENEVSGLQEKIFSPRETNLFLGKNPEEEINMPEPVWKIVRTEGAVESVWLPDGSGLIQLRSESTKGPTRQKFEAVLEAVLIDQEDTVIPLEPVFDLNRESVRFLKMSDVNNIYMLKNKNTQQHDVFGKDIIVGCEIEWKEKDILCNDFVDRKNSIIDYDLLPDEGIIFIEKKNNCIWLIQEKDEQPRCTTRINHPPGNFIKVSPDGQWIAFTVFRDVEDYTYQDLYIVEFPTD